MLKKKKNINTLFNKKFILASNSKSRKFILKNNKLDFVQISPTCNEEKIKERLVKKERSIKNISLSLAKAKAKSVSIKNNNFLVVGSDTIIELKKKMVVKAKTLKEARKKIKLLSGKKHCIYSSAAAYLNNKLVWKTSQKTSIKIRGLTTQEINQYLKNTNKDILGSVGCFQIEKDGPNIIENIRGDFFNVMGFPLFPFLKFLKKFNIKK